MFRSSTRKKPLIEQVRFHDDNVYVNVLVKNDSNECEYIECGPHPPAEQIPSLVFDSCDCQITEGALEIDENSIQDDLFEQMKLMNGQITWLEDIKSGIITIENYRERFESATKCEKNIALLWCAFLKHFNLVEGLLKIGVDVHFYSRHGLSALHMAALSGCVKTVDLLLSKGINVDFQPKCYTPLHCAAFGNSPETAKLLIKNGADIQIKTKEVKNGDSGNYSVESLLQCAVRANAAECVEIFIAEGADPNDRIADEMNPIHLAVDLDYPECLEALLKSPLANPNIVISFKERSSALHLAAREGNVECVNLLLAKRTNANIKNEKGLTALHLAARASSLDCVESLLRVGKADPNDIDLDGRTPLHAAVTRLENAFDILEMLISHGANINHRDNYGFTAIHLAAADSLSQCVDLLIFHDADVSIKANNGTSALNMIIRKSPESLAMITQKLNGAITINHLQDPPTREVELELNFRQLLQHNYPHEINYLNTFIDEGQEKIVQHPLCSSFLHIKWTKIRKYYVTRLIISFIFVLLLSLYVLTALAHNCYNCSKGREKRKQIQELCQKQSILGNLLRNSPFAMEMQWWVLLAFTVIEMFRKTYGIFSYSSFKAYVKHFENVMEWFVIVSVFVISNVYMKRTYTWQNHIGAFAVLFGWTNLMLMVGQLPSFDVYVAMYTKVQIQFAKVFLASLCMLIGFSISFSVIFPTSASFGNPFIGFITTLVMMIGEQELSLIVNDSDTKKPPLLLEVSAQIIFVLFLVFVTIILMNLLVGIAVDDIQGLKKTANLSKLVRQTKLIANIESALFNKRLPKCLKNWIHSTAVVAPQGYRVVLCVRPLNPRENRLPRNVLRAAYDLAKRTNKHCYKKKPVNRTFSNDFRTFANQISDYNIDIDPSCDIGTGGTERAYENSQQIETLTKEVAELKETIRMQNNQMSILLDRVETVITSYQQNILTETII